VPVQQKKRKHAEEEEEESDIDYATETEEEEETGCEEEEEDEDGIIVSDDEEEVPSTSKTLKAVALTKKKPIKRSPVKKTRVADAEKKEKNAGPKRKLKKKTPKDDEEEDGGKKKLKQIVFNDKNVDYNLYNEAPEHIKNLKIKLSSNVVVMSRMIEASGGNAQGLSYDYAALSFVRQSKNGKAYEFNMSLNLAPNIIKALNLLIKGNPTFFEKALPAPTQTTDE
jgi:hypothetical protein